MKKITLLFVCLLPCISLAQTEEIKQLQKKCANEQSSAFKNTRGTPSCDHLDRLHEYQRPEKAKPQPIVVEQLEYWYEGNQYCGHNAKGETVHCY